MPMKESAITGKWNTQLLAEKFKDKKEKKIV
jgi:hypothetical protein